MDVTDPKEHVAAAETLPRGAVDPYTFRDGRRAVAISEGHMASSCWCDRAVVSVHANDVRRGRTNACGRAGCEEGTMTTDVRQAEGTTVRNTEGTA